MPVMQTQATATQAATASPAMPRVRSVVPKLASGGGGTRGFVGARGGGGGGGGGHFEDGSGDFNASGKGLTENDYRMIAESLTAQVRYQKCKKIEEEVKTAEEAVNTQQEKTSAQQERTQTAQAQVQLAKMATQLVNAKQQTAGTQMQIEQERNNNAQAQLQVAQMATAGTRQMGGAMEMLRQGQLQSMTLRIQLQQARNNTEQQWQQLAGWGGGGGNLPGGQSFNQSSFYQSAFNAASTGNNRSLPGGSSPDFRQRFFQSDFKLRPPDLGNY